MADSVDSLVIVKLAHEMMKDFPHPNPITSGQDSFAVK